MRQVLATELPMGMVMWAKPDAREQGWWAGKGEWGCPGDKGYSLSSGGQVGEGDCVYEKSLGGPQRPLREEL